MNDHPNALELIRIASQTLESDVLPSAKPEHVYALRMIANALGIAARELETCEQNALDEMRSLNALYHDTAPATDVHERNRRLAQDIRSGKFEASSTEGAQLRQHLSATARAKLAVAYPKGLEK